MAGRRVDLASGAALLVFALLLWFWLIPTFGGSGEQLLLPRLVAGTVGALALVLLAGTAFRQRSAVQGDDPFVELGGGEPGPLLALAAVWGLYCLGLDLLGFYAGGLLALPASFLLLGVRRPVAIAGWTLGSLVLLHLVFERGFQLRMPKGDLERLVLGS